MGKAKRATRKAQTDKMLWGYSRGFFLAGRKEILGHLNWKKKKNREQTYRAMEKGTPGRGNSLSKGVEVGQAWSVCEKWWKVL